MDNLQGYNKLLNYIDYFEDESREYYKWKGTEKNEDEVSTMPYPIYDDRLQEFIQDVIESGLMKSDYISLLKDKIGSENDAKKLIDDAEDLDILTVLLTYFVRQERFQVGLWGRAAKDKVFLNLLLKISEFQIKILDDEKKEYIVRQLARTHNKKYENYVITRIWHQLDRVDVKIVTQQYVTRPTGHALIDLYFPQIGLFVEVDESHHKSEHNVTEDKIRDKDVVAATENQIIRIDVTKGLVELHNQIENLVKLIRELIDNLESSFIPWNISHENDPVTYINKGMISLKENVAFRTSKDACNCFGYKYKKFQRGGTKHPLKKDTSIWFPKLYPHGEWENKISSDGSIIWERNVNETKNTEQIQKWLNDKRNVRIVFAQGKDSLGFMRYRFKGVFRLNREKTFMEQRAVWERISDEVETVKTIARLH
ncbi:AbaSI family restriction endonuclease [Paenibacillus sp. CAU 1782]